MTVHRLQYIEGTVRGKIANREKYKQTEEWRRLNGRTERSSKRRDGGIQKRRDGEKEKWKTEVHMEGCKSVETKG